MSQKNIFLIIVLCITALGIVLPKPDGIFSGIVVTYIGFTFLNMFPFLYKFQLPKVSYSIVTACFLGFIVYGCSSLITVSGGESPGISAFIGAVLILISVSGLLLSVFELIKYAQSDGAVSVSLYTGGMYALVRHPQVLFSILLFIGCILFFWCAPLLWSAPLWIIGFVSYAAFEEKLDLAPRFEDEYLAYCDRVPAIIPDRSSIKQCLGSFH